MLASEVIAAALLIGVALVGSGLWVVRASAMPRRSAASDRALPLRGVSFASRAAIGLSLMFAGYHVAAWGTPEDWLELKVPRERWYLLVGGIVVAVGVSLAMDRIEKRSGDQENGGGAE